MSKKLEQFIKDNREAFDSEEPSSQLWKKLQTEVGAPKKDDRVFHLSFLRWTAAAAVIIMMAGMFYYMEQKKDDGLTAVRTTTNGTNEDVLSTIDPVYAKEVYHFTQLIELKQTELKQIENEHPELYRQFVQDIHRLDSSYQALRTELPKNPNRELLLETMIQNLRLQADLLNQQLSIIKQLKNKNTDHEKGSKTI